MAQLDYKEIDAILKEDPDIGYRAVEKECKQKVSQWSFHNRKRILAGLSAYKAEPVKKVAKKKGASSMVVAKNKVGINIVDLINKHVPASTRKAEYRSLAKKIISNPDISYDLLKRKGQINFSDANFYQLRRKIRTLLGLPNVSQRSSSPRKSSAKPTTRKPGKPGMYQNVFAKQINGKGLGKEAKDLLVEFIEELNTRRIMNLEIVEVLSPNRTLEVRSFAKV